MTDFKKDAWSILIADEWHAVASTRFTSERLPEFKTACGETIIPKRENKDRHRMPTCAECLATDGPGLLPKYPEN